MTGSSGPEDMQVSIALLAETLLGPVRRERSTPLRPESKYASAMYPLETSLLLYSVSSPTTKTKRNLGIRLMGST